MSTQNMQYLHKTG